MIKILEKRNNISILKVKRKKDDSLYLLKTFHLSLLDKKGKQRAINEIKIISSLKHPNIVEFKESFFDKSSNTLNLVTEYPIKGKLSDKINFCIKNEMYLEETTIWNILTQILCGLNYLHKKGIIHRNLKSSNIFLANHKLIKIGNFDSCYLLDGLNSNSQFQTTSNTNKDSNNYKCDIWSLGCIIYEMSSLCPLFKGQMKDTVFNDIKTGNFKFIPNFYSKNLKSIMNDMIKLNSSKETSTDILLNYPNVKETAKKLNVIYLNYKNNLINIKTPNNSEKIKTVKKGQEKTILLDIENMLNKSKIISNYKPNNTENNSNSIVYKNNFLQEEIKKMKNSTYRTLKERFILRNLSEKNNNNLNSKEGSKKKYIKNSVNSNSNLIFKQYEKNINENLYSSKIDDNINNKTSSFKIFKNNLDINSLSMFNSDINNLITNSFYNIKNSNRINNSKISRNINNNKIKSNNLTASNSKINIFHKKCSLNKKNVNISRNNSNNNKKAKINYKRNINYCNSFYKINVFNNKINNNSLNIGTEIKKLINKNNKDYEINNKNNEIEKKKINNEIILNINNNNKLKYYKNNDNGNDNNNKNNKEVRQLVFNEKNFKYENKMKNSYNFYKIKTEKIINYSPINFNDKQVNNKTPIKYKNHLKKSVNIEISDNNDNSNITDYINNNFNIFNNYSRSEIFSNRSTFRNISVNNSKNVL